MDPMTSAIPPDREIACQQVLLADASVFSVQWTDLPAAHAAGVTAETIYRRYLTVVRSRTGGLIVPRESCREVAFLLAGRYPLLRFRLPLPGRSAGGREFRLHIHGGLLVQSAARNRGELLFRVEPLPDGGRRIVLQVTDYHPVLLGSHRPSLFRRWLYRLTQAAVHRWLTIRFLAGLHRAPTGVAAKVRLVPVMVREGRPT